MRRLILMAFGLSCFAAAGCHIFMAGGTGSDYVEPDVPPQDVIPINGDSSAPVDEVMDGEPSLHPVVFYDWGFSRPAAAPVTIYRHRDDGDVDVAVISPDGLSVHEFQQRMSAPIVLVPLGRKNRESVERDVANLTKRGSGVHVMRARLHAYCVEAAKPAATPKTVYAIADGAVANRFASVQGLLRVAERAAGNGTLRPQGDPRAYGRFIAQYAAWTKLEGWDQSRFTKEFIDRTRREMDASKKPWTSEIESTLRTLAPARWRDMQLVIADAAKLDERRLAGGTK